MDKETARVGNMFFLFVLLVLAIGFTIVSGHDPWVVFNQGLDYIAALLNKAAIVLVGYIP